MRNNQFSRILINFSIFSSFSFRTVKSAEKIKLGLPRIKIAYLLINYANEKKIVLIKKKGEKKKPIIILKPITFHGFLNIYVLFIILFEPVRPKAISRLHEYDSSYLITIII